MSRTINAGDLTAAERRELAAAFGREPLENGDIVDVTDELEAAFGPENVESEILHAPEHYDYIHCPDCRGAPMMQPVAGRSKCRCVRCGHEVEANR